MSENKTFFKYFLRIISLAAAVFLLSTCDNLLQIGMGDEIDLTPPSNSLVSPDPGSFINGNLVFEGTVSDDQEVANVEISFDTGATWAEAVFDQESWSYGFNAGAVDDGRLTVLVRATDSNGKETTSEEYLFSVDNTPPIVMVTSPTGYEQNSYNTVLTLTVAATDVYQIESFTVDVEAATIPDGFDTENDDPNTLSWESLDDYPKQIDQSASPLSYEFTSLPFTTDIGETHRYFRFSFSAEDEAGNASADFFHIDDISAINDNLLLTVDQISDILDGTDYTNSQGSVISASDLDDVKRNITDDPIQMEFDEDTNLPSAKLTFPTSDTDDLPTMRSTDVLQGYFEDDDGIDTSSMQLRVLKADNYDSSTATADSWEEPLPWTQITEYDLNAEIGAQRIDWDYAVDVLGQGIFRITLDAQDVTGADRPEASDYSRDFMISDGAPDLDITPPSNQYFNDRILLSGTASHSIAVTSVELNIGYGPADSPTWIFEDLPVVYDGDTLAWAFNTDDVDFDALTPAGGLTNLDDGEILIQVTAKAGTEFEQKNQYLYKDTVVPLVSFDRPDANSQLNTDDEISGSADDADSGIYNVDVLISHPDDPKDPATAAASDWHSYASGATLATDGYEFGSSVASWRYTFDTTGYTDENTITFYIRGTDRAGNTTTVSRNFEINQDSDLPVISLSNLDVSGTRFDNVLSGEPRFLGAITDDDAVDPDTFMYRVRIDASTWGDWEYAYTAGEKSETTRLDFNIPIYAPGTSDALDDGSYEVQLWVEDNTGIGISRTAAESGGALDVALSVDGNPPVITISAPASGSLTNEDFDITGTVTDGLGIALIELSTDGGTSYPTELYTYSSGDPEVSQMFSSTVAVGGAGLADGTHNLRVRAVDFSGISATENTTIIIDTTAPVITLNEPVDEDSVNDQVVISGIVEESLQMDSAWYWIGRNGIDTPPAYGEVGWIEFSDSRNLNALWDSYTEQDPDFSALDYDIDIIARDTAGNWSELTSITVAVNQESDRPVIEFSNIEPAGTGIPSEYGNEPDNLFGANAVLNGSVSDDDGITGTDILISTRSYDWTGEGWGEWSEWSNVNSPFEGTRTNGSWSHDISALDEGVHQARIRVFDENSTGGLDADDFKWNQSDSVEFAIDIDLPSLTVSSPEDGAFRNSSFTITGTASDSNRLLEYNPGTGMTDYILLLENDGDDWSGAAQVEIDSGTSAWTYDVAVSGDHSFDGDKTWQIRAEDRMGNIYTDEYNFTVDTIAPSTEITAFSPSVLVDDGSGGEDEHVNGTVSLDALAGDVNGISEVKYWVLLSTADAPTADTFETGGTVLTGQYLADIVTTDYADSTFYTLYVGSEDNAGNRDIISREIFINQDSDLPTFSYSNVDADNDTEAEASLNLLETGAKIIGAASDDDGVDSSTIEVLVYDVEAAAIHTDWTLISNPPSSNGTYVNWMHDLSTLDDGVYYVQFRTNDINGIPATSSSLYFTIDLNPAQLNISFPESGSYQSSDFNITGTASDENGLMHGDHDSDEGTPETDYLEIYDGADWQNVAVTAGSWSFPVSAPDDNSNDDSYTYQVRAADVFGKTTTKEISFTIDTLAPSLTVISPTDGLWTPVYTLSVDGESSDSGGVASVEVSLDNTNWTTLNGTVSWNGLVDLSSYGDQLNRAVYFRSTDNAGNSTSTSVEIDIDRTAPVITETLIDTSSTVYFSTDYILSGSLSDNLSGSLPTYDHDDDGGTAEVEYIELSINSGAPTQVAVSAGNWSYPVAFAGGIFSYEMSISDRAGNSSDTVSRTVYADASVPALDSITSPTGAEDHISGSSYSIAGTASDTGDAGLSAVYWWAGDNGDSAPSTEAPYTGWTAANGTSSWTGSLNLTALGEGEKTLHVFAVDNCGLISTVETVDLTVDQAAPVLIEDGLGGANINASGDLTLEVSVIESNGLAVGDHDADGGTPDVEYFELMLNGSDWATDAVMVEYTGADTTHTITTAELSDGENVILLRATDLAGRTSTEVRRDVFFDETPPTVSFINLTGASVVNGESYTIQGTTSDTASTISSVTIAVNGPGDGGYGAEQAVAGSVYSWSYDLDLTPSGTYYADGGILVRVTATDSAGNITEETVDFSINQLNDMPTISLSGLTEYTAPATADVTADETIFAGVIFDADGVDLDTLTVTVDSEARTFRVVNGADDAVSISWFVDLSDKAEGSYSYTVSADDSAGNPAENNVVGMIGSDIPVLGLSAKISGSAEDDDSFDASSFSLMQNGTDLSGSVSIGDDSTYIPWSYSLPDEDNVYFFEMNGTDATTAAIPVNWSEYSGDTVKTLVVKDSGAPVVTVTSPAQGAYVNGTAVTEGEAYDDLAINYLTITAVQSDNTTSVELTSDAGVALDTTEGSGEYYYDTAAGKYVWDFALERLPDAYENDSITLVYEAEDIAGNTTVKERSLTIDTVEPVVAINSPNDGDIVNGNVTFQGTVSDVKLSTVRLQIGSEDYETPSGTYNWSKEYSAATLQASATDLGNGTYELPVTVEATDSAGNIGYSSAYSIIIDPDTDRPIVNMTSPSNNSTLGGTIMLVGSATDDDAVDSVELRVDFNGDGDFNDVIDLNDDGDVTDDFETESSWVEITNLSNGIWNKEINTLGELYKSNVDDMDDVLTGDETIDNTATGDITVQIHAWDINFTESLVTTLNLTLDETFPEINDFSVTGDPDAISGSFELQYDIEDNEEITSVAISYDGGLTYADVIYDGSGTISTLVGTKTVDSDADLELGGLASTVNVRMKAVDNTGYVSFSNLTLNIDNVAPTGTYTGRIEDIGTETGSEGVANDVWLAGNAVDTGAVRGIDKIEVYIIQDGSLLEPEGAGTLAPGTYDFGEGDVPYTTNDSYKITIDNHEEVDLPAVDDGDGYWEQMTANGSTIEWQAQFDSQYISNSDPLQVHFVIWDNAGNAVHYVETMMMVGTDLDQDGSVGEDEMVAYPQGFKATDLLKIEMDPGDNTDLYLYVEHNSSSETDIDGTDGAMAYTVDISGYTEGSTSFEIEVRDSSQGDAAIVSKTLYVEIVGADATPPTITLSELTQSSIVDGHLETNSNYDGADYDVSGTVTFSVAANDNSRIQTIEMIVENSSDVELSRTTLAQWNSGLFEAQNGATFTTNELSWQDGHDVAFTIDWDSSSITGTVDENIEVRFEVTDFVDLTAEDNDDFDVVPFISSIDRGTAFNTFRSKYGYYSVRRGTDNGTSGEEGDTIRIFGYNLFNSTSDTITFGSSGAVTLSALVTDVLDTDPHLSVEVPTDAASGAITLTVNGLEAINNQNSNNEAYHSEANGYIEGSDEWTDDRYAHIWQSSDNTSGDNQGYFSGSSNPVYPAMTIDESTGTLYASWSDYANSIVQYGTNNDTGETEIYSTYDPTEHTDIDFGSRATVVYNANVYGGATWTEGGAGGVQLWDSNVALDDYYNLEELYHDQMLMQFINQRVVNDGNNIHVSYYDTDTKAVKYHYVQTNSSTNGEMETWVNLDGGYDGSDGSSTERTVTVPRWYTTYTVTDVYASNGDTVTSGQNIIRLSNGTTYTAPADGVVDDILQVGAELYAPNYNVTYTLFVIASYDRVVDYGGADRSSSVGEYSAIDVQTNGNPVVAYYDSSNQTVKLAVASANDPSASDWTLQTVMDTEDTNYQYSGKYISMIIDGNNDVHLVFYRNSTGDLIYMKSTEDPINDSGYVFGDSVILDSIGSVGAWADISLDASGRPVISYLDSSRADTFDGLKMAYWNTTVSDWEYMNVPLAYEISNYRTSVEYDIRTDSSATPDVWDWETAIGYSSSDYYRVAYYIP